jgi:predicted RNA methylase
MVTQKSTALKSPKKAPPKFIGADVFAGAGGMTLGAQAVGIEVVACVENDPNPVATYSHKQARGPRSFLGSRN